MQEDKVIIGTTANKKSAYALEYFIRNQKAIQEIYPNSELVIASNDLDPIDEEGLRCRVIKYPSRVFERFWNALFVLPHTDEQFIPQKIRIWDMVKGRNAARDYFLKTNAGYFLSVDADMVYNPHLIPILMDEIKNYDVVMSAYMNRNHRPGYSLGCALIKRKVLEKVRFNCLIFHSFPDMPNIIEDGWMFEHDTIQWGFKINRGIFIKINHLINDKEGILITPRKTTAWEKIKNNSTLRYFIVEFCILTKRDIPRIIVKKIGKL